MAKYRFPLSEFIVIGIIFLVSIFMLEATTQQIEDTDYNDYDLINVGNITGDDVDINAGTGDYTTTGTVKGTAYIIGANTLNTNEWAYLDGQDQSTSQSDDVTFNKVHLDTDGTYLSRDVTGNLHLVDDVIGDYTLANLTIDSLGTATYQYVQDWVNTTQSAGKISGGTLSDSGGGEIDVAAGTGFIKTTDNALGTTKFFNWSAESNISLTDNSMNYLYIDYNSGSPQVGVTTTRSDIHFTDQIGLGRVYRESTTLTILSGGVQLQDSTYRTHKRLAKVDGFIRATGCATSMTGLKVAVTAGTFYYGITPLSATALDTAAADTITYIYSDGASGWTSVTGETDIDNTYYDDGDGTLGTLTVNQYGTGWLYWAAGTSDFYVVYGTGSYKLNEAQETTIPASLPPALTNMGLFVARIIIEKSAATKEQIDAPWDTPLGGSGVTDHGDLTGLSDDDHTQYLLVNATRGMSATTLIANLNADLLDSQTGAYYIDSANFTGTNWTDLTDGGDTTLHDHDGISENTAARHTQGTDTTLGTMTADIDMDNSYQVVNLQAPAASGEAIRQTAALTEATLEAAVANYTNADYISDGSTNAIITLTQETNFETAYTNRVDSWTAPLAFSSNTASLTLLKDVVATAPLLVNATTNVDDILPGANADLTFSMPVATTSADGYLSQTDWDTFNNKQAAITGTDTHVMFFDGANTPAGEAGMTYNKTTNNLTTTTFSGALSGNATTATTASAGDAALDFFGAGVTAVTDATACTDIEGTDLSITGGTLNFNNSSGYITGNETITLSGDVSGSGTTSIVTTIGADKIYSSMIRADEIYDSDINWSVAANGVSASDMPDEDIGDISITSGSYTLDNDIVAIAEMADSDHGDFTYSSGSATLDTGVVADNEIDYTVVNMDDMTDGSTNAAITLTQETAYDAVVTADPSDYDEIGDLPAGVTLDAEWNTEAEVEAIWAATDIYTSDDDYTNWVVDYMAVSTFTRDAEWDTESEFEAACETKNFIVSTEIDTEAEFEAICATLDFYTSDDSYTDWVQGYMMADDSVDSAEYVNGSIDLVHLAAGVYAKDIVTTSPITGGTDNVLVGADSDVTIAITVLKDLVTTSPLAGGTNDIFPGADSDITISIADAAADGSTKGAATFDANDFDAASGVISIDNVNFTIEDVLASVAAGDMIYRNDSGVWGIISKGADNDVFTMDGNYPNWEAGGAGSGDVTSSANITDHSIVRGDGGAKGVQDSGIIIDDSDRVTGVTQLTINQTDTASSFYVQDGGTDIMEIYDGGIIDMPKQSKARVYRATSSQPVASGVFTKVQFNAANYDIQSEFDIITNYRFTAKKKGYYLISASLRYSASVANKFFMVNIYKNGSSYSRDVEQTAFADELSPNVVDIIFLDIDDYIEIYAYHNAGTNQNIYFMGHNNFCAIHKLS